MTLFLYKPLRQESNCRQVTVGVFLTINSEPVTMAYCRPSGELEILSPTHLSANIRSYKYERINYKD